MTDRLVRGFGFLLCLAIAGCGGINALPTASQRAADLTAASAPLFSPDTSTATSCSSFYACKYTITTSKGTGSASTYYYFYNYAANTEATYQLPGQAASTTSQPYETSVLGNTGNTYHVGGSFIAIDANTNKVVDGTTDDYIIQTQHCGPHGCWYTYALSSGTIKFKLTSLDATTTSVACNPSTFPAGGSTRCKVTVADVANSKSFPTGSVSFSLTISGQAGTFTPPTCKLSSGSCSVSFAPSDETVGTIDIAASYPGDTAHYLSAGSTQVYVSGG